ncbi:hypothetical protein [Sandarakinorhabdus sp.]|uniref:hypothetical protein n=1 Tax=Sandarakinorhabdus sp. TaxID=1916663 RepID=UPI00286DDA0E|nr:hypothetical protein [Sandarakinorhabdus sp.]
MKLFNTTLDWLLAVVVATVGACWTHSWRVQAGLKAVGAEIPPSLAYKTMMQDAFGMGPAVAAVFGLGLALAFLIAALLRRRWPMVPPSFAYALAGGAAVATALSLMKTAMAITPLAGAREPIGFAMMVMSGVIAGLVFAYFQPRRA